MIEKLKTTSRTTEVDDASVRMIGAYKKTSLNSDAHLAGIFTALESETSLLSAAIKRMKAESVLEEKDAVRDDRFRALYYLVQGLVYHPEPAIKDAAGRVSKVFDHYGLSVTGESYATESSLISSLLADLAKPNLQPDIAALTGCAELITSLQTAQDEFEATRLEYEEEKAQEGTQSNATELKKKVLVIINDQLVVYLKAMLMVDAETYGGLGRTIAEIIADNNEVVKRRTKKVEPAE